MKRVSVVVLVLSFLAAATPASAGSASDLGMDPAFALSVENREAPAPLRLAERVGVEPLAVLVEASAGAGDQLAALRAWNRSGRSPLQVGFVRPLPVATTVRLSGTELPEAAGPHDGGVVVRFGDERLVWGAEVVVQNAHRVKLHLSGVDSLSEEARLWVYGEDGKARGPFGTDRAIDGELWTPLVAGPVIRFEVEIPGSAPGPASFVVDSVAEIFRVAPDGEPLLGTLGPKVDTSCLQNAECISDLAVPLIDVMRRATALTFFVRGNFVGVCTGGLLNSASKSLFFLTANHCIRTRAAAATVDLLWDATQECGGSGINPDLSESFGADLLATDPSSDFSLLLLDFVPPGRALLGWDADLLAAAPGTELHRISHPATENGIFPQSYSRHRILANPHVCTAGGFDAPPLDDLTKFGYSEAVAGGVLSGSSGAPLITDGGRVVGQLFGGCGPNPAEGCDPTTQDVDGLFANTHQFIRTYLSDPEGDGYVPPPSGPWLSTASLPGFELKSEITSAAPVAGTLESDCIPETACFSGALKGRPEVFVKVIGPRPNGKLWTQLSRFTPSKVEVWLRQIESGEINYYLLDAVPAAATDVSGIQDRTAFDP